MRKTLTFLLLSFLATLVFAEAETQNDLLRRKANFIINKIASRIQNDRDDKFAKIRTNYNPWMTHHWNTLKRMPIKRMAVAGAHDAGANHLDHGASGDMDLMAFLPSELDFVRTVNPLGVTKIANAFGASQFKNIHELLSKGVRHLDLRFCLYKNYDFRICHGAFGTTADVVFRQIRDFMNDRRYAKEVVILSVRNFDEKIFNRWNTSKTELGNRFMSKVEHYLRNHLNTNWNMDSTLESIVNSGKRILFLQEKLPSKSFSKDRKSHEVEAWPNRDVVSAMKSEIKKKYDSYFQSNYGRRFTIFSWVLTIQKPSGDNKTPESIQALIRGETLRTLSRRIREGLRHFIRHEVNNCEYCNIINTDCVEENEAINIATEISINRARRLP